MPCTSSKSFGWATFEHKTTKILMFLTEFNVKFEDGIHDSKQLNAIEGKEIISQKEHIAQN